MINFDTDMDEETQPTIPSDITAEPVSDIDAKLGSHMLPKVVNLANQVSPEIRQTHSEIFSRLPIVVIHRYEPEEKLPVEANDSTVSNVLPNISKKIKDTKDSKTPIKLNVTVDSDELSILPNEPFSSILANNDPTIYSNQPLLNESLENNKTKTYGPIDNLIEEQTKTCNLNMNLQDELSNRPSSNSVLLNNEPINCTKKTFLNELSDGENQKLNKIVPSVENVNDQEANNIKIKKEIFESTDDVNDSEELNIKKIVKHIYAKTIKHSNKNCENDLNVDVIKEDEMKNKPTSTKKITNLDHDYYKTLSPESLQKEKDGINQLKNKIVKNMTSLEPELINHMKDYEEYVVDESQCNSPSLSENTNINQMVESDSVDTLKETPTSNAGKVSENIKIENENPLESGNLPGYFKYYDDQMWNEFSKDVKKAQECIMPSFLNILTKDDLTFEEMDKLVTEKVSEIMESKFDTYFENKNKKFMAKKQEEWRTQYTTLAKQLDGMNAIIDKHKEDVKNDPNATPRKLRRHVKVQTKRPKSNDFEPQIHDPVTVMHFKVDSTDSDKKNSKPRKNTTQTKTLGLSTQTLINNDSDGTSLLPTCSSSVSIQSNPTATKGMSTQTLLNNGSGCVSILPTCSSSVSIQTKPTATMGISTQTLLNNDSGYISVQPNSSSSFTIPSNTTATLGTSTQYLSNNTSNFISMLPNYPSIIQPAPQGSTQTVIDPRRFTFATNTDLQYPSLYMINGNNIPIRLRPGLPLMNNMNPRLGNMGNIRICSIRSLNASQNIQYLRPVPPAIPIEDDEPTVSRDHIQELPSLKQLLQAPTKRSLRSKTLKVKSREVKPIETISLLSPENSDESDAEVAELSSNIETQEYFPAGKRMIPKRLSKISDTQISKDPPVIENIESIDLSTPEPPEQLEINNSATSSEITNQEHPKASTSSEITNQEHSKATTSNEITYRKHPKTISSNITNNEHPKATTLSEITNRKHPKAISSEITNQEPPKATTSSEITNQKHPKALSSKITNQEPPKATSSEITNQEHSKATASREITNRKHPKISTSSEIINQEHLKATLSEITNQEHPKATSSEITNQKHPKASTSSEITNQEHPKATSSEITNQKHPKASTSSEITNQKHPKATSSEITNQKHPKAISSKIKNQKHPIATSSKITNRKRVKTSPRNIIKRKRARIQQSLRPIQLKKTRKVARVIARKDNVKTPDSLPFEIVDISSSESKNQKNASTEQSLKLTRQNKTLEVARVIARKDSVKTPDSLPFEIVDVSSTSSESTNQKNASTEQSLKLTRQNITLEVAADIMPNENRASTSNGRNVTLPSKNIRKTDLFEKNNAKYSEQIKPSWKRIPPAPIIRMHHQQTSEDIQFVVDINIDSSFAAIKSFLIYGYYKKNSNDVPDDKSWEELGEVNLSNPPIKCTLKKRSTKIACLFAARAVDIHNRIGPVSQAEDAFID